MTDTILLGTAAADITPRVPVPLSGFSFRSGNFESVRSSLGLKCFFFRFPAEEVVVFSADILCWGRDTVANCLARLEKEIPGAEERQYLFLATHTHCAPAVSYYFSGGLGFPDAAYVSLLEDAVLAVCREAGERLRPVKAFLYEGKTAIPINRRLNTEKGFEMAPNPAGPRNDDIKVIEFVSADAGAPAGDDSGRDAAAAGTVPGEGEVLALWACASCHPTASGDNRVDREFLVRGLDYFMAAHAPGAMGAYIQGCCGDTRPPLIRDGQFYRGSLDIESEKLAKQFSAELDAARKKPGRPLHFNDDGVLKRTTARLPFNPDYRHKNRNALAGRNDEIGEWARHFQDAPVPASMPLELNYFDLSGELAILFLSGEIVSEYSLYCRDRSNGRVWAGAYCNGMTSYIPTADQLDQGGYESYDSLFYLLQPAPFAKEAEGALKETMAALFRGGRFPTP